MTTGKAVNENPHAGNPHVRFDEGEVASAATPRRESLLYNENVKKAKALAGKGKDIAVAQLNRLSEKADAIPILKGSKRNKLIALGGVIVVGFLALSMIFGGGSDGKVGGGNGKYPNTPEGICARFTSAVMAGNADDALACCFWVEGATYVRLTESTDEGKAVFTKTLKDFAANYKTEKIDEPYTDNYGATEIEWNVKNKDGKVVDYPLFVKNLDGVWLIDFKGFVERRGCR